jgi:benzoyl-CoA reductase/2-hydroxyglutaryl-CoA dehydratase subunit BcrC/BadD/HgdB
METNSNLRKKKIGWLCSYVPEELIIAAGLDPIRLKGEVANVKEADSYVKNILDSGLRNKFENVQGIIFTNSCDGMRRLYDLWNQYVKTPFIYMLEIPRNRNESANQYFSEQLLALKTRLEQVFEVDMSNDKLRKAISRMNNRRGMMMDIFDKQKEVPSYFKGSDLLALCHEEATCPKEEASDRLNNYIRDFKAPKSFQDGNPRILIMGNVIDNSILFKMIENAHGSVIVFDTCNGLKHYSNPVEEGPDPIEGLARRYLVKPSCARMPGFNARMDRIEQLIDEYSINGIIYSSLKFCDYSLFEVPQVEGYTRRSRVPFLILENDYLWGAVEHMRNRVEAFLEVVRGELE